MRRVTIDPLTRLEGHGRVEIFLDEAGEVRNAYFLVPELRGFERFCVGRPAEEMPRIVTAICGLCPEAHHMASLKALDDLFRVTPTAAATRIRALVYASFFVLDHATHFFALAGPDLFLDPGTPKADRTILGVIRRLGPSLGRAVVDARVRNNEVLERLGGRSVHLVAGLPGGWSQPVTEETRTFVAEAAEANVRFALSCFSLFDELVLSRAELVETMRSEAFTTRTHSLGTVDAAGRLDLYDGNLRVVEPDGTEYATFPAREYADHLAERVEPWTTLKMPFLRGRGWHGLEEGRESGVYSSTPLSRLNAADRVSTPRAEEKRQEMFEALGSSRIGSRYAPLHFRLAIHWARLVEMLHAAERMRELSRDPELTDPDVRAEVETRGGVGIGSVEAPRGALIHHYEADERGIVTKVNLIVGTTHNHAPIALAILKASRGLIRGGIAVTEELLDRIEIAVRAFDPCLSCATHALPGAMPLAVTVRDSRGAVVDRLARG